MIVFLKYFLRLGCKSAVYGNFFVTARELNIHWRFLTISPFLFFTEKNLGLYIYPSFFSSIREISFSDGSVCGRSNRFKLFRSFYYIVYITFFFVWDFAKPIVSLTLISREFETSFLTLSSRRVFSGNRNASRAENIGYFVWLHLFPRASTSNIPFVFWRTDFTALRQW